MISFLENSNYGSMALARRSSNQAKVKGNHPIRFTVLLAFIIILNSGETLATEAKDGNNIHQIVKIMQEQERSIIKDYIQLSDDEATRFWAVFKNYQDDTYELLFRKVTLLHTFAGRPPPRSRELSESIIEEWIDLNVKGLEIKKTYVNTFGEVLPPEKLLDLMILAKSIDVGFFLKAVSETRILE